MQQLQARRAVAAAILVGGLALGGAAVAATPAALPFQTHASFFSSETGQARPIDPQVFVADPAAKAGVGPQGIKHAAGFRPAFIAADPATAPLYNADGRKLGFTLGQWLAASGSLTMSPAAGGGERITARFQHLRPHARYSLFENHFDQNPVGFTPLDGKGTANSFRTDATGAGHITVTAPEALTHANAVLVIYDDDGRSHGMSRGDIGVSAQHHLIARPPG